jgi:GTP-binding protein
MRSIVAIVGRPNVGKSTLFNRLVGLPTSAGAVVDVTPGTTRDRLYGSVEWGGRTFVLVDTGGIGLGEAPLDRPASQSADLQRAIVLQVDAALREAEAIVFLTDARDGATAADSEIAERLRRTAKPVFLVANKADNARDRLRAADLFELGVGEPLTVSAIQGTGTGDLLDRLVEALPGAELETRDSEIETRLAIVGRPNVGKSSLLNAIVGEERAIVDPHPGTTRDAVDTTISHGGQTLVLVDTAGIRRRGKVARGVETFSVLRAMNAIERADIAVVVLDAAEGIMAQDAHVAGYAHEAARGCVLAVNKWDLVERAPDTGARYLALVRRELPFLDYAPVVFISARTGLNVRRVLDHALAIAHQRARRVPTAEVNEFMREAAATHPLTEKGRALKVLYATQASIRPPTFVLFVNDPAMVHFSYRRYLENQLRRRFGFDGTGIRLVFRGRRESGSRGGSP